VLFARASALVMIVLAGLSTLLNALHPLTTHFAISLAILANGIIEWRLAGKLAVGKSQALRWMALNQLAIGLEILAYSAWRMHTFSSHEVLAILERPYFQPLLEMIPPEELEFIETQLPPLMRAVFALAGGLTALGCWAAAMYYLTRRKFMDTPAPGNPSEESFEGRTTV
jgi:hypothetical protein